MFPYFPYFLHVSSFVLVFLRFFFVFLRFVHFLHVPSSSSCFSFFDFSFFFQFLFLLCKIVFLFSCISFKKVSLLASVSGFNKRCFLRSRCSMEMWCPDDIGRENWDWVGPPAWERACFNSPEWGGGSSPDQTEPPQIVLLFLCCLVCVVW